MMNFIIDLVRQPESLIQVIRLLSLIMVRLLKCKLPKILITNCFLVKYLRIDNPDGSVKFKDFYEAPTCEIVTDLVKHKWRSFSDHCRYLAILDLCEDLPL